MALDESPLLEVLESLKAAEVGDRIRRAAEAGTPDPYAGLGRCLAYASPFWFDAQ